MRIEVGVDMKKNIITIAIFIIIFNVHTFHFFVAMSALKDNR